jgi:hypothetical protein
VRRLLAASEVALGAMAGRRRLGGSVLSAADGFRPEQVQTFRLSLPNPPSHGRRRASRAS